MAVVLYLRVSSGPQESKGNLDTYEWKLKRVCERLGIPVVVVYREICSGWVLDENRDRLIAAVEHARRHEAETGVHTAVLAPCTDRFVRNFFYNCKTNPDATPTKAEFRKLKELMGNVILLTYLNPDMSLREVGRRRTKWGQRFKNRKGGGDNKPGWKKRLRQEKLPDVLRLHEMGVSLSCIEWWTGVKKPTAWTWIKNAKSAV